MFLFVGKTREERYFKKTIFFLFRRIPIGKMCSISYHIGFLFKKTSAFDCASVTTTYDIIIKIIIYMKKLLDFDFDWL